MTTTKIARITEALKHPAGLNRFDAESIGDLSFSARAVLLLLARNIEKGGNGHVQLSERQAAENGIERKTLRRALADLVAHQMIVMTWRGGKVQGACNKYALTWLPVKAREGIHAEGFKLDAWREWQPEWNKTTCRKCPQDSAQNVPLTGISIPEISPTSGDKKGPIELIAIGPMESGSWMPAYLDQLAARGLAGHQCFQIATVIH